MSKRVKINKGYWNRLNPPLDSTPLPNTKTKIFYKGLPIPYLDKRNQFIYKNQIKLRSIKQVKK